MCIKSPVSNNSRSETKWRTVVLKTKCGFSSSDYTSLLYSELVLPSYCTFDAVLKYRGGEYRQRGKQVEFCAFYNTIVHMSFLRCSFLWATFYHEETHVLSNFFFRFLLHQSMKLLSTCLIPECTCTLYMHIYTNLNNRLRTLRKLAFIGKPCTLRGLIFMGVCFDATPHYDAIYIHY